MYKDQPGRLPPELQKVATAMAIDCVSEWEMETVISFTPAFFAAFAASPWS
jgi:hypothetical protein